MDRLRNYLMMQLNIKSESFSFASKKCVSVVTYSVDRYYMCVAKDLGVLYEFKLNKLSYLGKNQ